MARIPRKRKAQSPPTPISELSTPSGVLQEAGMGDERFVRRMVEDLKEAGTDLSIAKNATLRENRAKMLCLGMRFMHSLYLVDEVEKDPISREQMMKVEKAFAIVECERQKAVAAVAKMREEKAVLLKKLKDEEARASSLKEENLRFAEQLSRLQLEIPALIAEATKSVSDRAVEEFRGSAEMAQILRDQHRKSVTESTNFFISRGWLNIDKFRADRELDKAQEEAERSRKGKELGATQSSQGDQGKSADGKQSIFEE